MSPKLTELREKAKACHQALVGIEARAGIAEAAERLRNTPPSFLGVYDLHERHSDAQREAEQAEMRMNQEWIDRRLRELYFGVKDVALRRELMTKDRECGDISVRYFQQELGDAAANLTAAKAHGEYWWLWASAWGVALIGGGFYFFGLVGALGGLLAGCFSGWHTRDRALADRNSAVAEAEHELRDAEETWNRVRNEPQNFSRREAQTGDPDPDPKLRLVGDR